MKRLLFIVFLQVASIVAFCKDYTFCLSNVSVTLFDGGRAEQLIYGTDKSVLKRFSGEWTAGGSGPTQTIKIIYTVSPTEFSYELVRDGYGVPSVLIDGQGRNYTLCKTADSKPSNSQFIPSPAVAVKKPVYNTPVMLKFVLGEFVSFGEDGLKVEILKDKNSGKTLMKVYQNFSLIKSLTYKKTITQYRNILLVFGEGINESDDDFYVLFDRMPKSAPQSIFVSSTNPPRPLIPNTSVEMKRLVLTPLK
jgi:hypothetical protein